MNRIAIYISILPVFLSAFLSALLLLDWCASGIPPWVAEGPWAGTLPFMPPLVALIAVGITIATHHTTDLLGALGIWTEHQRSVAEAEARGERPA